MLDHVFMTAIESLRQAFEQALLERHAVEERFQVDILLGDTSWETSYSLPGEGVPPRVVAELTLDWPTWSQTAYRLWSIGEGMEEPPEIDVELVLRVQRLEATPDPSVVLRVLPDESPSIGDEPLHRSAPVIEQLYDNDLGTAGAAIEVSYDGGYRLDETALTDTSVIDGHFSALGGWIASLLVRLGDLSMAYLPPDDLEGLSS